ITVGKDQEVTVKSKGAGGQGKVAAKVTGPAGKPVTCKMGETGEFVVDCTNAGPAELTIEIISDSGTEAEVHIQDNGDGTYTITYIPLCPGSYTLTIRYGGQDVPNFPARLTVEPAVDASGVRVFGPGATTDFTVDARALNQTGGNHIKTVIQNPSGAVTDAVITDRCDGTYNVEYTPYEEGPHCVKVAYDESPVPNSPFRVAVTEGCDPGRVPVSDTVDSSKVKCQGVGLGTNVRANIPQAFTVDASKAGVAPLQVRVQGPKGVVEPVECVDNGDQTHTDPEGKPKKASIRDNQDGTYLVSYVPDMTGRYTILIKYGGDESHTSPGSERAGVGPTIQIGEQTVITVDAKAAGKGKVTCSVCTPEGVELDVDVVENEDGTFDIFYSAPQPGDYCICVRFGGELIPNSPFQVTVKIGSEAGPQKVRAWGPGLESGIMGKSADFVVEAVGDNYWPMEAGEYAVHVLCNNEDIQHSPFMAEITAAPNKDYYPDKVKVHGPGLQSSGLAVGKWTEFTIDARLGGKAPLKILAQDGEGTPVDVQVKDNGNGTYTCSYTPKKPLKHTVMASWGGVNIPDSPFRPPHPTLNGGFSPLPPHPKGDFSPSPPPPLKWGLRAPPPPTLLKGDFSPPPNFGGASAPPTPTLKRGLQPLPPHTL
ncbi:unnamed protein product, partial [Coregonus sp. 'balchen']